MAEIISTVDEVANNKNDIKSKEDNFNIVSKKIRTKTINKVVYSGEQTDPRKLCMTSTIIPNKRPVEKKDIESFVKRVKETNVTKQKNKVEITNKEEKKKRGRPKKEKKVSKKDQEV
jgi:hypothetical protein